MFAVKYRKISYTISILLVLGSIFAIFFYGLNLSIDFTGGTLLEISYTGKAPEISGVNDVLDSMQIKDYSVREVGAENVESKKYLIRSSEMDEGTRISVSNALKGIAETPDNFKEERVSIIGPVLGKEAMVKSLWSIIAVVLAIILFIAFAFRHVSKPVSSWKYGVIAVIALIHDIMIPIGVFAVLGYMFGIEVDTLFVTALLVIFGFSVHDTIVVFDRVRENLRDARGKGEFSEIVGGSISQTMGRSINTSFTTLLALVAIMIWGPASVFYFTLALIIGIISGTYSSICLASPLLVTFKGFRK